MKIIYYSYYGCYSTIIAAYIHSKIIDDVISKEEFYDIPEIFEINYGILKYIGIDENNNEIYVIAMKNFSDNIKKTFEGLRKIFNLEFEKIIFVDTSSFDVRYFKIYLYLRKVRIFKNIIDYILYKKIMANYRHIKSFVDLNKIKNNIIWG
ncbi:MAG: DUF3189 family protein [Thermoanaerobacteraceae bacterium]|nr:DUF3189 family protein [Thermoanaerobacteraceae bacterium]